jgi:hypothetical protein
MLRELGYAPAAARDGRVNGPIRAHQVDWAKHARPDDEAAVLCLLAPPHGDAPHVISDHVSTWLAAVTVNARGPAAAEVLAAVERVAPGAVVRVVDGAHTFLFRTAERMELSARARDGGDSVYVDQAPVTLGSPADWRSGVTLLDVARAELPELSVGAAGALIDEAKALFSKHAPDFVPYTPPEHVPATERTIRMERGNTDEILDALRENGYAPVGVPWGDEPSGRAYRRGSVDLPPPALAVFLRPPTTSGFTYTVAPEDHRDFWLVLVTVKAAPKLAADVDRVLAPLLATGKRVARIDPETGATLYLFKHDAGATERPFDAIRFGRGRVYADRMAAPGTHVSVTIQAKEFAPLVLGPGVAWGDLLKVRRDELPEFDHNRAESLVAQLGELLDKPQPADTGIVERAKRAIRGAR